MRFRLLTVLLFLSSAFGQTSPDGEITRLFTVRYANVNHLRDLLGVFGAKISIDSAGAIAAHGSPATVDAIGEAIKRLDVAPAAVENVEIDVYMLMASRSGSSGSLPKELDAVVKQLKGTFNYQDYRLLETAVTRTRDGGHAVLTGFIPMQFEGQPMIYALLLGPIAIASEGKERSVRINNFKMTFQVPYRTDQSGGFSYRQAEMNTDLDVREGQKVVVGKSNINGSNDAMILVVTAKLVN
ncbi:MAG: hypothetical protein ACR2I2_03865 [Bryobacteraceae bacterium]